MKTVAEYVYDASAQLNDQYLGREYTRWTRALLISYLNGALAELSSYKPEIFTSEESITLAAGRRQVISDPYKSIVSVNSNADGSVVHESDLDLIRAFAPYDCCAVEVVFDVLGNPVYAAKSYAIDPKEPKAYYVSPQVPVGLAPTVKATVSIPPARYTLASWGVDVPVDAKYEQNIMDYMMGRAFDIDTESPMSKTNSDKHLSRFYTAMGVKYRVESAYRAGNYNGSIGEGDPRARL